MQLKFIKVLNVLSEITSVEASVCNKPPQPPKNIWNRNFQDFRNCFVSYCVN